MEYDKASLGWKPSGKVKKSNFCFLHFFNSSPPEEIQIGLNPFFKLASKTLNVSSVFPEYEETIINVFEETQLGNL